MSAIAAAFRDGGIWMYIILAVSIISIGITIERFIFLFFKYSVNAEPFMAQIQKLVMANNIDRAIKLCNAQPAAASAKEQQKKSCCRRYPRMHSVAKETTNDCLAAVFEKLCTN